MLQSKILTIKRLSDNPMMTEVVGYRTIVILSGQDENNNLPFLRWIKKTTH